MFGFGKNKQVTLVVVKSDDIDENRLNLIKNQIQKAINSNDKNRLGILVIGLMENVEILTLKGE